MGRIAWVLLLVSLPMMNLAGATPPENDNAEQAQPPMPLQVQAPSQPLQPYEQIIYVMDVSCSMSGSLESAISVIDVFATDEFKATAITFDSSFQQWKGVEEECRHPEGQQHTRKCLPRGWGWMPKHRKELLEHLRSYSATGGTCPTDALTHAFKTAPDNTLIVLISDGDFNANDCIEWNGTFTEGPLTAVKSAMAWRETQKLAPVQMLVWAVSEADSKHESLIRLAALGGGGLWRANVVRTGPW